MSCLVTEANVCEQTWSGWKLNLLSPDHTRKVQGTVPTTN